MNTDFSNVNNDNDYYTDGIYSTYNSGIANDSLVNQYRKTVGDNFRNNLSVTFSEPLSKKLTLRVTHNTLYLKQNNTIDFFSKNVSSGKYEDFNQDFSNGIKRDGWKNTSTASLSFRSKKLSINPGINYLTATFNNYFTKNPAIKQHYNYVYPSLSINYGTLNLSYQAYIQEPDASYLQKVIDVSNRFYQQFGNPELQPGLSQSINLNAYKYNPKNGNSYNAYVSGSFTNDAVIREVTIDRNGIQTTKPVNVDGTYNFYGSFSYSYQYKYNKDLKLSLRPQLFGQLGRTIISINSIRSGQNNFSVSPSLSLGINYKDKIEFNQRYSQNYRKTTYENSSSYKNISVLSHSIESEVVIRMPKHIVWENLVNYNYNPQVGPGIRKSSVRWNAGVNYLFLKDDKAQIKLSVYDLLNQNINVYRTVSDNYVSDVQTTSLTRYFMLTFTYNLRNFTGGKVGGKDRSMFFF